MEIDIKKLTGILAELENNQAADPESDFEQKCEKWAQDKTPLWAVIPDGPMEIYRAEMQWRQGLRCPLGVHVFTFLDDSRGNDIAPIRLFNGAESSRFVSDSYEEALNFAIQKWESENVWCAYYNPTPYPGHRDYDNVSFPGELSLYKVCQGKMIDDKKQTVTFVRYMDKTEYCNNIIITPSFPRAAAWLKEKLETDKGE